MKRKVKKIVWKNKNKRWRLKVRRKIQGNLLEEDKSNLLKEDINKLKVFYQ